MPRLLPLLLLLAVAACAQPQPEPRAACPTTTAPGPVLLQEPPVDVSGPFYAVRTDGPCGLFVAFTGAPQGDGPCLVQEYVGRVEPAGDDLRLVVEERHTGPTPSGQLFCTTAGAHRWLRVELDEPLHGRVLLDEQGHAVQLVDGEQLQAPETLPEGWSVGEEGTNPGPPAHWSWAVTAPGLRGELRQGGTDLPGRVRTGPGYRRLEARTVRGVPAELGAYQDATGNHLLTWTEGDRGFVLQALGPLQDADVLVEVADGLRRG